MGKIFQIGFNRCGTRSICHFFDKHKIPVIHWDNGNLAATIRSNDLAGEELLKGYEKFTLYSDIIDKWAHEHPFATSQYYKKLDIQYPGSKFIFNDRPVEDWIQSRLRHSRGQFAKDFQKHLEINEEQLKQIWRDEYIKHKLDVYEYFTDRDHDLLKYSIAKDSILKLTTFFNEYRLNPKLWGNVQKNSKLRSRTYVRGVSSWL
tara:strand:- start:2142 stop:2753 length:612 start_codon:yes stop_codon:yes gene_type:complete